MDLRRNKWCVCIGRRCIIKQINERILYIYMYKNTRLSRWTGRIDVVSSGCRSFGSTVGGKEGTPSGGQSRATRRAVGRRSAKAIQWPWPTSPTGPSCAGAAATALPCVRPRRRTFNSAGTRRYMRTRVIVFHTPSAFVFYKIYLLGTTVLIIIICRCIGCYYSFTCISPVSYEYLQYIILCRVTYFKRPKLSKFISALELEFKF